MGIKKETAEIAKERQKDKKKLKKKATKRMVSMIIDVFRVSNKEIPIYKIRLKTFDGSGMVDCSVAFSKKSNKFYHLSCADPVCFATSEKLLKCGEEKIRDVPKTIGRLIYFENTMFSKNILDWVYEKMRKIPQYQITKMNGSIEITLLDEPACEK